MILCPTTNAPYVKCASGVRTQHGEHAINALANSIR